ncbi:MAG: zinc ribbon domain-containing protein [Caldilineaceae bacterium]|nr:zinc ribbon domain-containing protein [Caldilineaceae bacterium]
MPIYEFACADCGTTFEKRVSFSAVKAPACDNCNSENVERQLSAPAIHFKGSGWYITDSKKSSNGEGKKDSTKSDSSSSESSGKTSASTETTSSSSSSSSSESTGSTPATVEKSAASA